MSEPHLRTTVEGGVATIAIDRPKVRNALASRTLQDLRAAVEAAAGDPQVAVLVLTGSGDRAFCAGADLNEYGPQGANGGHTGDYDEAAEALHRALEDCPKPVLGALNGAAIGGGCLLSLACDLRLAVDSARFRIPIARYGFMIGPEDTRRLVSLVGPSRAKWLLLSGLTVEAETALAWGLVDALVPRDAFADEVAKLTAALAAGAPATLRVAKALIGRETKNIGWNPEELEALQAAVADPSNRARASHGDR